jgi:hypothetical protein
LEEQWINANYAGANKELCIKTGSFSSSEPLEINVWNSTSNSWIWIMNLTANQWNNVSVAAYLTAPTFTIQLLNGASTGDLIQESWNIDCSLLHTWGEANVYINPASIQKTQADISTVFNVSTEIAEVTDLQSFEINITWDPSLLSLQNVDFTALNTVWGTGNWICTTNQTESGCWDLVAQSTAGSFTSTTDASLTTLEFLILNPRSNQPQQSLIHFATHMLTDSYSNAIPNEASDGTYEIAGVAPNVQMLSNKQTCREYGEQITLNITATNIFNTTGFTFEIHYNATLLTYTGVMWNAWGTGTLTLDAINGNITGTTNGIAISGSQTLISLQFNASNYHIWKDESMIPGWENNQSGTIYIQQANLSYTGNPDLEYVRGGIQNQINMGRDFTYTFSPIQGDVNNDGVVDVTDLRIVSAYYSQANTAYNLDGGSTIELFDLVIVASNFGYTYP